MNIFDESSRAGKWAQVMMLALVIGVVGWRVYLITQGAQ